MNILVFKTNIQNQRMAEFLNPLFSQHAIIVDWSVDTEDCDNVLRIETTGQLTESDIICMVNEIGIMCEALPD